MQPAQKSDLTDGLCPTAVLQAEHRIIERVLDALEEILEEERIDATFMRLALDFFRDFADGCHHAKEENELFPMLQAAGVPREQGPIGCMLHEHDAGRALIGTMRDHYAAAAAGDAGAARAVRSAARQYVELLRAHIHKEDNILFVMADRILSEDDQGALASAFNRIEHAAKNAGRHERYAALAGRLYDRAFAKESLAVP